MARISVGAAVGAGFGLIARRPLTVLAWGVPPTLVQLVLVSLIGPLYITMISQMVSSGGGMGPMTAMQPQFAQISGVVQLINLLQLLVAAVVYCAVFRAILHPQKSAYAYLRVGAAELFLVILMIGAFLVCIIGIVIVMIPVGILIAVVAVAAHGSGGAVALLIPFIVLALMLAFLFFGLSFSFVGPMMVDDGKFHLFESWSLTKGRVASLLLLVLALIGVFFALEIVLVAVMFGVGAAVVGAVGGVNQLGALFQSSPQTLLARVWPLLAIYGLLMVPLAGCGVAIAGAPFAKAYRDVALNPADTSATFA